MRARIKSLNRCTKNALGGDGQPWMKLYRGKTKSCTKTISWTVKSKLHVAKMFANYLH